MGKTGGREGDRGKDGGEREGGRGGEEEEIIKSLDQHQTVQ